MALKTGDVVWLKSGGPSMTVEVDNGQGTYQCAWFNKDGGKSSLARSDFYEAMLTDSDPGQSQDASALSDDDLRTIIDRG